MATALSKITGYPVLHPHLFTPIATALMQGDMRTNREFRKLSTTLRLHSIRAAIRAHTPGIILTGVHIYETRQNYFIEMLRRLPAHLVFIRLVASEKVLMRRVTAKSRHQFDTHKITTREKLLERITTVNVTSPIRGVRSITIDTEKLKPKVAAQIIAKKLKIQN